jgi:hypothetical protein
MNILHILTWIQIEIIMEGIQDCVKAVQQEHQLSSQLASAGLAVIKETAVVTNKMLHLVTYIESVLQYCRLLLLKDCKENYNIKCQ